MIRAIVFDFGGVLATDTVVRQRLAGFDRLLGWEAGALYHQLYGGHAWRQVSTGAWDVARFWAEAGAPYEAKLPAAVQDEFRHYCDPFFGEPLDPATVTLARQLSRRYLVALLSNATPLLAERLAAEPDLHGLFSAVVISALAGVRKPEARAFALVCHHLGLPPAACVMIDDKERNTAAARAAGMAAIRHLDAERTRSELAGLGVEGL
jgi:putative hydrolase of the HAD superfamily